MWDEWPGVLPSGVRLERLEISEEVAKVDEEADYRAVDDAMKEVQARKEAQLSGNKRKAAPDRENEVEAAPSKCSTQLRLEDMPAAQWTSRAKLASVDDVDVSSEEDKMKAKGTFQEPRARGVH